MRQRDRRVAWVDAHVLAAVVEAGAPGDDPPGSLAASGARRRGADASLRPQEPLITAVTLAELSVGPLVAKTDEERAARQAQVQQAESDFDPLPFEPPRHAPGPATSRPRHRRQPRART